MDVRLLTSGICLSLVLATAAAVAEERPPLLDFQKMQALKLKLADHIWEVEVRPAPDHPDVDPETVPPRHGQGVLVDVPDQGPRLLVSGDLIRDWRSVTAGASRGRSCAAAAVRELAGLDVALIRCAEPLDGSRPVLLAPDELAVEGALVFSLDNPAGTAASIYHGFLAGPAEAPLAEFHYVHLGGTWSYPLLNHREELVALTLRRLRPQPDSLSLAVTCRQLRQGLAVRRRNPEGPNRLRSSERRPFYFE